MYKNKLVGWMLSNDYTLVRKGIKWSILGIPGEYESLAEVVEAAIKWHK